MAELPSVSEILKDVGLSADYNGVPAATLERARLRGQGLHKAVHYDLLGVLDEGSIHPEVLPGVVACREWRKAVGFQVIASEIELCHPTWKYCLPEGSYVMSERGGVPIEQLTLRDRLYDQHGILQPIHRLIRRHHEGVLISIKCRKVLPLQCTPDHRVLTASVKGRTKDRTVDDCQWKSAANICPGDWLVVPRLSQNSDEPLTDPVMAYFYGRFVGDGSTTLFREGPNRRGHVRLTFGHHEWQAAEYLRGIVAQYGAARIIYDGHALQLQFGRTQLAREFRERFGAGAPTKRIPPEVMGASPKIIKEFLRGYYEADGWNHQGQFEASTISLGLALQLQFLSTRLGALATLYLDKRNCQAVLLGRPVFLRDRWRIRIAGTDSPLVFEQPIAQHYERRFHVMSPDCIAVPVVAVDQEQYAGNVYDVQTSGSFVVNNVVVHNCGHPDAVGKIDGRIVIPDWKFVDSLELAPVAYQLAAYGALWTATHPTEPVQSLLAVQLGKDGRWKQHDLTDFPRAWQRFQAALIVYRAKREE